MDAGNLSPVKWTTGLHWFNEWDPREAEIYEQAASWFLCLGERQGARWWPRLMKKKAPRVGGRKRNCSRNCLDRQPHGNMAHHDLEPRSRFTTSSTAPGGRVSVLCQTSPSALATDELRTGACPARRQDDSSRRALQISFPRRQSPSRNQDPPEDLQIPDQEAG